MYEVSVGMLGETWIRDAHRRGEGGWNRIRKLICLNPRGNARIRLGILGRMNVDFGDERSLESYWGCINHLENPRPSRSNRIIRGPRVDKAR